MFADFARHEVEFLHGFGVGDFDVDDVAGFDHLFEAGVFDAGEDGCERFGARSVGGEFFDEEDSACLENGFAHKDAGHDGVAGVVPFEEKFVCTDFTASDEFIGGVFDDAIEKEERRAMRDGF